MKKNKKIKVKEEIVYVPRYTHETAVQYIQRLFSFVAGSCLTTLVWLIDCKVANYQMDYDGTFLFFVLIPSVISVFISICLFEFRMKKVKQYYVNISNKK